MKWLFDAIASFMPAFDWKDVLTKNGLPTIAVVFLAVYFVLPAREDQHRFTDSIIETNKMHADSEASNAVTFIQMSNTQAQQTSILQEHTSILREIKDRQNR